MRHGQIAVYHEYADTVWDIHFGISSPDHHTHDVLYSWPEPIAWITSHYITSDSAPKRTEAHATRWGCERLVGCRALSTAIREYAHPAPGSGV